MYKDSLDTKTQTSPQTISLPIPGAEYTVRVLAFNYMDSTLGGDGVESNNVTFTAGVLHDTNMTLYVLITM